MPCWIKGTQSCLILIASVCTLTEVWPSKTFYTTSEPFFKFSLYYALSNLAPYMPHKFPDLHCFI